MRDWRPIEFVISDVRLLKKCGERLRDAKFTFHVQDREVPMWNDEARRDYPDLSFLLDGFETRIYPTLKGDESLKEIYDGVEKDLHSLVTATEWQVNNPKAPKNAHAGEGVEETVLNWFFGKWGDEGFGSSEENNERLLEWVRERHEDGQFEAYANALPSVHSDADKN